jgi:hypothetical protein
VTGFMRNPIPMGTANALGAATQATQLLASKAYGSMGGRSSARRRKSSKPSATRKRKKNGGGKLKFGSPAWRKKYMKSAGGRRKKRK